MNNLSCLIDGHLHKEVRDKVQLAWNWWDKTIAVNFTKITFLSYCTALIFFP
jgi:hypothetical protein